MIVPTVDLRTSILAVRHQGRRNSCLAFASSTAHEIFGGLDEHLCVEYLHFHAVARTPGQDPLSGTTMHAAGSALAEEGQPVETAWPYSPVASSSSTPPAIATKLHKATMKVGKLGFDDITAAIDHDRPVIMGLVITDEFLRPNAEGWIADKTPDIERAGHAVLAVGHGVSKAGDEALLVRNSWGSGWGIGGYGWLPRPYVDRQLHETAMLE